jgi:hypothetical protein
VSLAIYPNVALCTWDSETLVLILVPGPCFVASKDINKCSRSSIHIHPVILSHYNHTVPMSNKL